MQHPVDGIMACKIIMPKIGFFFVLYSTESCLDFVWDAEGPRTGRLLANLPNICGKKVTTL
jgi:hypothetical protein